MLKTLFVGIAAALLTVPAPALADDFTARAFANAMATIDAAPEVPARLISQQFPKGGVQPDISRTTPAYLNFIMSSPANASVPCFSCVNGNEPDTMGIPVPYSYVYQGSTQSYVVSWSANNYTGSCRVTVSITNKTRLIQRFGHVFLGLSGSGGYDAWFFASAPGYSGPALMTAKLSCGHAMSTMSAPLLFQ